MTRKSLLAALGLLAIACVGSAVAFGTVRGLGQNAEHERITRHALACTRTGAICFEAATLDELAGKSGRFGAVGAPDQPVRGLMASDEAHCDNGDYLAIPGYPHARAEAQAQLERCRQWMDDHINAAVTAAGGLLKDGRIDASQLPTWVACSYDGRPGRAKCMVLEHLGLALHAAQDFYSHSNWVDLTQGPTSLASPPGLGMTGRAPWLDLRYAAPFPDGLMTGCYKAGSVADVDGLAGCAGRVTHVILNKDKGDIDPVLGQGHTSRGKVRGNFGRAVTAAIDDTSDKWRLLQERIIVRYGPASGRLIICAIAHDRPDKTCQ